MKKWLLLYLILPYVAFTQQMNIKKLALADRQTERNHHQGIGS